MKWLGLICLFFWFIATAIPIYILKLLWLFPIHFIGAMIVGALGGRYDKINNRKGK